MRNLLAGGNRNFVSYYAANARSYERSLNRVLTSMYGG